MIRTILVLLFVTLCSLAFPVEHVTIYNLDDHGFSGQLLFGTDSILYVWTGTFEFDRTSFKYIKALPLSKISKIDLKNSITWKEGIGRSIPSGVLSGLAISVFTMKDNDAGDILLFNGIYNFVYSIVVGGFASANSKIPKYIRAPAKQDFDDLQIRFKNHFLLSDKDRELISEIIAEVKP